MNPLEYVIAGFAGGWVSGCMVIWWYFWKVRMLRTRKEYWSDPIIKQRYGDDPNPKGWSY